MRRLLAVALFLAARTAGAQASFDVPASLAGQALFGCGEVRLGDGVLIDSAGNTTGAARRDEGHVVSGGDLVTEGRVTIRGDATVGTGGALRTSPETAITGRSGPAQIAPNCRPIDLSPFGAPLTSANDNGKIPKTARGRSVLRGASGTDFVLDGFDRLTLPAGTYVFSSIRIAERSVLAISGPVRILCRGPVDVTGNSHLNAAGGPFSLRLFSTGARVSVTNLSTLGAVLYAPEAAVLIDAGSRALGGLFAQRVALRGASVFTRVIDDTPPVIAILSPTDGDVVAGPSGVRVRGFVRDPETAVFATLNGRPLAVGPSGAFDTAVDLPASLSVEVEATNAMGLSASQRVKLCVPPPELTLLSPVDGALLASRRVVVRGSAGTATDVSVNGVKATVSGGFFTLDALDFPQDGGYVLSIVGSNACGSSRLLATIIVAESPPSIAIDTPAPGTVFSTSPIDVGGTVHAVQARSVAVNGFGAVAAAGRFTASGVAIPPGASTLVATVVDGLGRTARSGPVSVRLEAGALAVRITSPAPGSFFRTPTVDVQGTVTGGTPARVTVNGVAAVLSGSDFTARGVPLAEGENRLVADATDASGRTARSPEVVVILKTHPPVVALDPASVPPFTRAGSISASGTVEDPYLDNVTVNGILATVAGTRFVASGIPLVEGPNILRAHAVDLAGNSADSDPLTVLRKTVPPVLAVTSPTPNAQIAALPITVTGTVSDPYLADVRVMGQVVVVTNGRFTAAGVTLPEGDTSVLVTASDTTGLISTVTVPVVVDTLPPVVTIDALPAVVGTQPITVTGTVDEPHLSTLTVAGVPALVSGGRFTAIGVPLSEGPNQITAVAIDTFGHRGESAPVSVALDSSVLVLTLDAPAPAPGACLAGGVPVTISGTLRSQSAVSLPVLLTVTDASGGPHGYSATPDAAGRWSVPGVGVGAVDGTLLVYVTATGANGQAARLARSFRVKASSPSVQILLDGAPFPGSGPGAVPPSGAVPALLGRAVAPRVLVSDGPSGVPPPATLTLDGSLFAEGTAVTVEGTHLLVGRAVDCAGHEGAASVRFTVDLTPPRLLGTSPADGASLGAAVTSFSGTSDPDLAAAKVNGFSAVVSAGTFTLSPFPWHEGANTASIELTDQAGNRSFYTRSFAVKTLAPAVEILESGLPIPSGVTFYRAVAPVVRSNDPSATVTATLNGTAFTSGTAISTSGAYTLSATAADSLGHTTSATALFKVDLTPGPAVDITSPADRAVVPGPTVAVTGTASASVEKVTVNGIPAALSNGSWTLPDLRLEPDVLNEITAVGTDAAGRSASAVRQVLMKSAGPTVLILDPPDGFATNRKKIDVAGAVVGGPAATADGKVVVAGATLALDALGSFRAKDVSLVDGVNALTASAVDAQGRTGLATVHVTSDATLPSIALSADGQPLNEGDSFIRPFTLRVAITKPSGVPPVPTIRLNGQPQAATSAVTDLPITANGGYVVSVVARDAAGNETRADRGFTLSLGGCAISELDPADGSAVAGSTAMIRGRSGNASSIVLRVPNPGTSPVTYQSFPAPLADGTFALAGVPLPVVGENLLAIDCTDRGGNLRSTPMTLTRLSSGAGPVVKIASPLSGGRQIAGAAAVSGTVSDGSATVTVNGLPAAVTPGPAGDGTFGVAAAPLAEGPNVLYALATDAAGRRGEDRIVFFRDSNAPKVQITSPVNNAHVGPRGSAPPAVDVTGLVDVTTEPNLASVAVATSAGSATAALDPATGAFSAPLVPLPTSPPGTALAVTATATDTLGQAGTSTVNVFFDASGPALLLASPADLTRYSETSPPQVAVSGEAWAADGAQISINGGGLDPGTLAWEPAAADGRRHTVFGASVDLPAADGAFGIVARVDDPSGKFANDRRLLYRDTAPPTVVDIFPPDGSKTVDPNEILLVLFSEPVLVSSLSSVDGLTLTRLSTGEKLAGIFTQAGNAVALTPAAILLRGESYRFRAGSGVTDLVGHALAAPKEVTFTVALSPSGSAPVLDPIAAVFCATDLTVSGAAAPGASLRLRDGNLSFSAVADSTGRFSVKIPLSGNGFHSLRVAALDRDTGASSPEAVVLFRVDCSAPTVVGAAFDRTTGQITVSFSEAMSAGSLTVGAPPASLRVSDAEDSSRAPQSAAPTLSSDGTVVTLDLGSGAGAWWQTKSVRLEAGPPASDVRGNVMTARFETVFFLGGGDLSGAFLSGEAYDDASGRPLEGADVKLFASGAALPGSVSTASVSSPVASTVTDGRGRFSLVGDVPAGRYALVLSRSGTTRVVRRLALEPAVGAVPFDSRLTPLAPAAPSLLDPATGGSFPGPAGSSLLLDVAPAALPGGSLGVVLTPISGQGLPDLLPLGWTPLAAAEVRLLNGTDPLPEGDATPFAPGTVKLTLPLPTGLSPSASLYAAAYDVSSGLWVALSVPEKLVGAQGEALARVTLSGPGSMAVLVPDPDPTAPPSLPDSPGTPLLGSSLPDPIPALTAQISLDPPVVAPTGRANARVVALSADNVAPWPSGLAVQAYLDEKLILSGGGELYESPFSMDLVLHHSPVTAAEQGSAAPAAAGAMGFRVSPSPRAAQVLLETGYENIRLYPFPDQIERGSVLGPAGGSVTSPDGTDLFLPEGALPQKTVVKARLLSAAELASVAVPQGFTLVAGVRVDLSGYALARAATLKINAPQGLLPDAADDPRLVLSQPVDQPADGRGAFSRVVARVGLLPAAGSTPARLVAAPEGAASTLPLAGITTEGVYLFLHASAPIGFATGLVRAANGAGYAGSRVTATGLGTADLSQPGGRYAVPAPAGAVQLLALHPTLSQRGTAAIPNLVKGDVAQVDIVVQPVPPAIRSFQPVNGATDQPVGTTIALGFTGTLDPASVTDSTLTVETANADGTPTGLLFNGPVVLSPDRTTVVLTPTRPLPPGRKMIASFKGGVRGSDGTPYAGPLPVSWSFTTSTVFLTGGAIHPEKIRLLVPVNGVAQIVGEAGALPAVTGGTTPWSVWADWDGAPACPSLTTVPANASGGFTASVGCPPTASVTIASQVYIHILDPTGTEAASWRLGPFTTPDGKGFVAPPGEETVFTTAEGIQVTSPAAAFGTPTIVTVTKLDPSTLGVPIQAGMELGAFINVDFDGTANETLRVRIPVVTSAPAGGLVFAGTPVDLPWGRRLKMLDVGRLVADASGNKFISTAEADQPSEAALTATPAGGQAFSERTAQAIPKKLLQTILAEFTARASAGFIVGATLELSAITGHIEPALIGAQFALLYNAIADTFIYVALAQNWNGNYILPTLSGKPFNIVQRDPATGWILLEKAYDPVSPGPAIVNLGDLEPSTGKKPPTLIDASPFGLTRFTAPSLSSPETERNTRLGLKVEAHTTSSASTSLRSVADGSFAERTSVELYNLTQEIRTGAFVDASGAFDTGAIASKGGDELLALVSPSDLDADSLGELSFDFSRSLQAVTDPSRLVKLTDCGSLDDNPPGPMPSCVFPSPVAMSVSQTQSYSRVLIQLDETLPRGHQFKLELQASEISAGPNPNDFYPAKAPATFVFATRPGGETPVGDTSNLPFALGDTNTARDLLKFGNLLLVGSASGQLLAVDVTDPREPKLFARSVGGGASQIRSFATDGHNRLFYVEEVGSTWAVKAVRLEDVRHADLATCGDLSSAPDWQKSLPCFAPARGGVKVSLALGSTSGLLGSEFLTLAGSLPTGSPTGMETLARDDTTGPEELRAFCEEVNGKGFFDGLTPGADGTFEFAVKVDTAQHLAGRPDAGCGEPTYDPFERVTVDNLTTGQSWSIDVENKSSSGAQAAIPGVRARRGDNLRLRYSVAALGYIAVVGSGISVVDLNRFYNLPSPAVASQQNKGECGRRLGRYEGADLKLFANCATPSSQDEATTPRLEGISNTPALAVVPSPAGKAAFTGVDVYSPLTHYGAVHTNAPASPSKFDPGALQPVDVKCLRKTVPAPPPSPSFRSAAVARNVSWQDLGITATSDSTFVKPTPAPAPRTVTGDLVFFSLGPAGIAVFDITDRGVLLTPIGRFYRKDHTVFRLQADEKHRRLYAGGTNEKSEPVIDVWDIERANGGPSADGVYPPQSGVDTPDPRLLFTVKAPFDMNHIGLDDTGMGLIYTWGVNKPGVPGGEGGFIVPIEDPAFLFAGLYQPQTGALPSLRPTRSFVPLGSPTYVDARDEQDETKRLESDKAATAAFRVRVSLPGGFGETLLAKVQSLRALPDKKDLAEEKAGPVLALPGGPGWPKREVFVTLKRLGKSDVIPSGADTFGETGKLSNPYNEYESQEVVLLLSDPRAAREYWKDVKDAGGNELADEETQCRRCSRPAYLKAMIDAGTLKEADIKELLAGGPYVRVFLSVTTDDPKVTLDDQGKTFTQGILEFFGENEGNYRAPTGAVSAVSWADEIPSPVQIALAEPAQNPALWDAEAGASVSLTSGEAILQTADHAVRGRALGFTFDRTYRSGVLGYGPLGSVGWTSSLFAHLRELPPLVKAKPDDDPKAKDEYLSLGEVQYHDGGGHVFKFYPPCEETADVKCPPGYVDPPKAVPPAPQETRKCPENYENDSAGSYCMPKGLYLRLQKLPNDQGFRMVGRQHDSALFDASGLLVERRDRHFRDDADPKKIKGSRIKLTHDVTGTLTVVEDDLGRSYRFDYESDSALKYGLLRKITDFAGREITYDFGDSTDDTRRLLKVTLPEVTLDATKKKPEVSYSYSTSTLASTAPLHGPDFSKLKIAGFKLPLYLQDGKSPDRVRFEHGLSDGRVSLLAVPDRDNESDPGVPFKLEYTADGSRPALPKTVSVTAPWGHPTQYSLADGRIEWIQDGRGVDTFDPPDPAIVQPPAAPPLVQKQAITWFEYEDDGRLKKTRLPDLGEISYKYPDPGGDRLARANILEEKRSFGGGTKGLTDTAYDSAVTSIDPSNYVDNIPRVLAVDFSSTDAEKKKSVSLAIPGPAADGSTQAVVNSGYPDDGVGTDTTFDDFGRPTKVEGGKLAGGGGSVLTLLEATYDKYPLDEDGKGLPKKVELDRNVWEEYEYDNKKEDRRGNVTKVTTSFLTSAERSYDEWDRVVSETNGEGGAIYRDVSAKVDRVYDAAGHLVAVRRQQKNVGTVETQYAYNGREQVVSVRQTMASSTDLSDTLDPRTVTLASSVYDKTTGLLSAATRGTAAGEPGVTTEYGYDQAGRLKSVHEVPTDGVPSGTRSLAYDINGRLVYRNDGDEGAWYAKYDAMGRIYFENLPTGAQTERLFDKAGRVVSEKTSGNVPDPPGSQTLVRKALSEGTLDYTSFGARLTRKQSISGSAALFSRNYYDALGRPIATAADEKEITSSAPPSSSSGTQRLLSALEYWPGLGFLKSQKDAFGNELQYVYPAGSPWYQRVTVNEAGSPSLSRVGTNELDALGRIVLEDAPDGTHVERTLDEAGNLLSTTTGGGNEMQYVYDGRGLVIAQKRPGIVQKVVFAYDAGGRLLSREVDRESGPADLTTLTYDSVGRLKTRLRPGSEKEEFAYFKDGTLATHKTRLKNVSNTAPLTISYTYDAANRLTARGVGQPTDFAGALKPAGLAPIDAGDAYQYDPLSRLLSADVRLPAVPSATPQPDPRAAVSYQGYDLRGLPQTERVGAWPQTSTMSRSYDVWGNTTEIGLPPEVAISPTTSGFGSYKRSFDVLDRLTNIKPTGPPGPAPPELGGQYTWSGFSRLQSENTTGPLGLSHTYTYGASTGRLSSLAFSGGTTPLGQFNLSWDEKKDLKSAKTGGSGSPDDITHTASWSYSPDAANRLRTVQGPAGTLNFQYGKADELIFRASPVAGVEACTTGAEGRLLSIGSSTLAYDGEGRRTSDEKAIYTWDWRGRLVQVDLKPAPGLSSGERVLYEYDALGRLLSRTHLGALPSGETDDSRRPFIAKRLFVFEGAGLLGEAGQNFDGLPIWRKQYLPGPSGLDDASQIRVETDLQTPGPRAATYSLTRDEQGSVTAVFAESAPAPGAKPQLLARFQYDIYGSTHVEVGPELLEVVFDAAITKVKEGGVDKDQAPAVPGTSLPGALKIRTSLPLDPATLDAGLKVELFDSVGSTWNPVTRADFAIAEDTKDASTLYVMSLAGWPKDTHYRVRITSSLADTFGRKLVLPPPSTTEFRVLLDIPPDGTTSPAYERTFPLTYDSSTASANTVNGAIPGGVNTLYTGAWTDPATGLVYLRNRWLDTKTNHFLQDDPIGPADSENLYAYVGWQPHMGTDPWGLEASVSRNGWFVIANPKGGRIQRISPDWAREHPSGVWYALKDEGGLSDEEAEELIRKAGLPVVRGGQPCRPGETCLTAGPKDRGAAYDVAERTAAVPVCGLSGFMNNVDAVMGQGPPVPCPIGPPNSERQEQIDRALFMYGLVAGAGARGAPASRSAPEVSAAEVEGPRVPRINTPIGRVEPPIGANPGTTTFGNAMHQRIAAWLQKKYPRTEFEFRIRPGQTGVDVTYTGKGPSPGFVEAEIKPRSPSGEASYGRQVESWNKTPNDVLPITYDAGGNIYVGWR